MNLKICLIYLTALVAVVASFTRLFYGIDFTDEGQYVAQALGPILGADAFVTDRLFHQSGSFFATPFVWIFVQLTKSTEGIVLFCRLVYFLFCNLTAILLYKSLCINLKRHQAAAIAILPIVYIPFSIPSVSYNTMAVLLSIATLSLLQIQENLPKKMNVFWLSATIVAAIFSYPPTALAFLAIFSIKYFKSRSSRKWLGQVALAVIFFSFLIFIWLLSLGVEELRENFKLGQIVSLQTLNDKLKVSYYYLQSFLPTFHYIAIAGVVGIGLFFIKKPFTFCVLPILLVHNVLKIDPIGGMAPGFLIYGFIFSFSIFALVNILSRNRNMNLGIISGLIIGLVFSFTSSNGIYNASLGFFIGFIFLLEHETVRQRAFPYIGWLSVLLAMSLSSWTFFYRESKLTELNSTVDAGPFRGLRTTVYKYNFLNDLNVDFALLPDDLQTIFSYDSFAGGYLYSFRTPKTFMYYMHPVFMTPQLRPYLNRYFSFSQNLPDIVLEVHELPLRGATNYNLLPRYKNSYNDSFWNFFKSSPEYSLFIYRDYYSIYVRKN